MAVPKRKTTPSRRGLRRSHNALSIIISSECTECGEMKLPHHMCLSCNFYKGRSIIIKENTMEDA